MGAELNCLFCKVIQRECTSSQQLFMINMESVLLVHLSAKLQMSEIHIAYFMLQLKGLGEDNKKPYF